MNRTIWLIRHGESLSNAGGRTEDPTEIPLTARGERQAQAVAAAFETAPALIVTSPYRRARQTARPTLERFPETPQVDWAIHEFTYLNPARFKNTTYIERAPWVQEYWRRGDPYHEDGDGAESFITLMDRVEKTIAQLQQQTGFTALFSHGLFIYTLLWRLQGKAWPLKPPAMLDFYTAFEKLELPNGAIVPLEFSAETGWQIDELRTPHL